MLYYICSKVRTRSTLTNNKPSGVPDGPMDIGLDGKPKERMKMAKKASEFLSAVGKFFEISKAFVDEVKNQGGTDEDVSRILTDRKVRQEMVGLLLKKAKSAVDGVVRVVVQYATADRNRTLVEMISDCGFDWVNSDITEKNFPIRIKGSIQYGRQEVEMKLFHFNRNISSDNAIQEMDKEGYRPAELPELLAYAKVNPDVQRKYPIVGLGSVWQAWDGDRDVPCLWFDGIERCLGLYWFEYGWYENDRFLAVRES